MLSQEVVENAEKRVGETIGGKWHLDRVIGVGGMAAVYEATHRNRNRVAIKLLHPALSIEEGTRQRFLREGYVANTIRHDGAVQVLDDDVTSDGYAFLVMELLKGESVEERMHRRGGALEIRESLQIAEQLLEVLEAAHDQNVVHRDIKPDNVFLTDEGKLKVLDFGIARLHQGDGKTTKVGSFMGTPAFCAQEQARGRWDEVDHRTDLYSVGATLFTCLTGTHVHEAETSSEQLALAIGATARSLGDVMPHAPKELVDLVDMALAYDKEDRFQTARAMRAAVRRVIAGLPPERKVTTPPPPSGVRTYGPNELDPDSMPPMKPSFRPSVRVVAGAIAAVLLSVLLFFFSQPSAEGESTEQASTKAAVEKEQEIPAATTRMAPAPSQAEAVAEADDEDSPATDDAAGEEKEDAQAIVAKQPALLRPTTGTAAPSPATTQPSLASPLPAPKKATTSFPSGPAKTTNTDPSDDDEMFKRRF